MKLQDKLKDWKISLINLRYKNIAQKLSFEAKKRKINIIFINCEASKWAYQSIYEKFASDERFNIKILISIFDMLQNKKYSYLDIEKRSQENFKFFKKQGMDVDYAYDFKKKKPVNLKKFNPDIIFYDEPQSTIKAQNVEKTSKYALNFYCSYGSCITNGQNEFEEIYKKLFVYFVDNSFVRENLLKKGFRKENLILSGQPKLDNYLKPIQKDNILWKTDKKHIIIAPHFSFDDRTELRFGTFNWNYEFFFEYAKNHPEYEFILKPHPSLKREIIKRKLMTLEEMKEYFKNWQNLPNAQVFEDGNYMDMFRTSDLLVTDCNSFLFEYLLTKKPVIRLINPKSKGHNEFGKKIIEGYYEAKSIEDIEKYFDKILIKEKDDLFKMRENIIKNVLNLPENGVNSVVYSYITDLIFGESR